MPQREEDLEPRPYRAIRVSQKPFKEVIANPYKGELSNTFNLRIANNTNINGLPRVNSDDLNLGADRYGVTMKLIVLFILSFIIYCAMSRFILFLINLVK